MIYRGYVGVIICTLLSCGLVAMQVQFCFKLGEQKRTKSLFSKYLEFSTDIEKIILSFPSPDKIQGSKGTSQQRVDKCTNIHPYVNVFCKQFINLKII